MFWTALHARELEREKEREEREKKGRDSKSMCGWVGVCTRCVIKINYVVVWLSEVREVWDCTLTILYFLTYNNIRTLDENLNFLLQCTSNFLHLS